VFSDFNTGKEWGRKKELQGALLCYELKNTGRWELNFFGKLSSIKDKGSPRQERRRERCGGGVKPEIERGRKPLIHYSESQKNAAVNRGEKHQMGIKVGKNLKKKASGRDW